MKTERHREVKRLIQGKQKVKELRFESRWVQNLCF